MSDHTHFDGPDDPGADHGVDDDTTSPDLDWIDDLVEQWDAPDDDRFDPSDAFDDREDEGPEAAGETDDETDRGTVPGDGAGLDEPAPLVDLALDDPDLDAPAATDAAILDPDLGAVSPATLHDALASIGADEAAAVIADLDVDHVDPRLAVSALDASGLDARVEHSDIGTLVEAVADGQDVVLAGPDGGVWVVTDVDPATDTVALETPDGATNTVSLRDLADAWSTLDHELLVLSPVASGPVQLGGETLVVALAATDLRPPIR